MNANWYESSDIEATVSADDCGGWYPHLLFGTSGARLLVKEEEAKKALIIPPLPHIKIYMKQ